MQKIRAEKEFIVRWSGILTNGQPDSLEGRDLSLYLINPYGAESRQEMAVEGNTVTFRVYADTCKAYGQYRLKLYENKGKVGQTVLDQCEGFCIVATTCQEGGITQGLDLDIIELSGGDMAIGIQGRSAYEIAVANGFEGTEAEWLASLKGEKGDIGPQGPEGEKGDKGDKGDIGEAFTYSDFTPEQIAELQRPASEAAQLANQAASKANAAAESATRAAQTATQTETAIKQAEALRVTAEKQRETNESEREQAETSRKQAESGRVTAEQGRVSAESGRVAAESGRVSAEQQRVTEFATLKQESETATTEATKAADEANKAAQSVQSVTDRLSETYPNLDAIKASGETNPNKIYIDAEKQTSYIYLNGEYVSVGGGNNLGASESCYGIIYGYRVNVIVGKEIIDAINACETISLLWVVKQNIESIQWFRYVSPLAGQNSNGLRCFQLGLDGSIIVFSNSYAVDSDLKQYAKSYRNVLSINRVEGIVSKMDEIGVSFTQQLDRLKQPDFVNSEDAISLSNGQYLYVAMLDMAIFNFDVTISPYKEFVLNFLKNTDNNSVMPSNFEHENMNSVLTEKYKPSDTYNNWDSTQKGEDGYYISTCSTTGKKRILTQNGIEVGKAKELRFVVEVIEGSFSISDLNVNELASNYSIIRIENIETKETKNANDPIGIGTWEIVIGSISVGSFGTNIKSVDVPVSVKFISQEEIPRGVLLRLKGDKIYDNNKVYDSANKKLVEIKSTPKKGALPFDSPRYGNKAPDNSIYPLYIGEKYYNIETGDIYEAGNLTTFKKLNDA